MAAGLPPPSLTPVPATSSAPMNSTTPGTPVTPTTPANMVQSGPDWATQITSTDTMAAVAQILQSPQGQQLQQLVQSLQQQQKSQPSLLQALDAGLVVQLQALTAQLTAAATAPSTPNPLDQRLSSLNKKLLDQFDLGEDSECRKEDTKKTTQSTLPMVSESISRSIFHQLAEQLQQQNLEQLQKELLKHRQTQQQNQEAFFGSENSATPPQSNSQQQLQDAEAKMDDSVDHQQQDMDLYDDQDMVEGEILEPEEKAVLDTRSRTRSQSRSRSRSQSRSRSPRKQRSRSRSGSGKRKHRKRSRSRSRERRRKSSRSYSSERQARERQRERQKKGLPPIRSKTLSVCSTTLWVGQVDKKATQQDLTNLFEEFGQVESINMIPPRGCAYICMVHRQDAHHAHQKLSTSSYKIGSKVIKIAWALNKGVKQEYKQLWDVDLGVTYIPWEKVKLDDLDSFAEGGIIDQETVNSEWEAVRNTEPKEAPSKAVVSTEPSSSSTPQAEAYTQQLTMMPVQLQVAQGVSAMGLTQPSFPVTMAMPTQGFGLPHQFLRAGFSASQPPPGFMTTAVIPQTAAVPSAATPLVQPSLPLAQDSVADAVFRGVIPPVSSLPGGLLPPTIPGAALFSTTGIQPQQAATDKGPQAVSKLDTATDVTLQGMRNAVRSGMGLLGMHPSAATLAHSLAPPGLPGQRMAGLLPLGAGARLSLLIQQGLARQAPAPLLDPSPQSRVPATALFPQLDPFRAQGAFGRSPSQPAETLAKPEDEPHGGPANTSAQQDRDQDYRFPPPEKQAASLLRMAIDQRESVSRPPLLPPQEDKSSRASQASLCPDSQWGPPRGGFEEREIGGTPSRGSKGFQNNRPGSIGDFPNRPESKREGRGGPIWNRRAGPFNASSHRNFDDRRRPWEKQQRDRNDQRNMNGNHLGREREWERDHNHGRSRERDREQDSRGQHEHKRGEWAPTGPPQPQVPLTVPAETAVATEQEQPMSVDSGAGDSSPGPSPAPKVSEIEVAPPKEKQAAPSPKDIDTEQNESEEAADNLPVAERAQTEGT